LPNGKQGFYARQCSNPHRIVLTGEVKMKPGVRHFRTAIALAACVVMALQARAAEILVATVDNGQMAIMQKLTPYFEKANPDIRIKWVTLTEETLRARVTADIVSKGGQFDVMTIGMYETPIWGKKGWLKELKPPVAYDINDLLPAIRKGFSIDGRLYAAPFYGESSMLMYRKDLTDKAGIVFSERPTWEQVREAAARIHNPKAGVYGICLRGKPGWGNNLALVTTIVNSFGGQWFDMDWKPQLESRAWKEGVDFYVNLLKKYGPPSAPARNFNENLALFKEGKCGMWLDATIAASFITDPNQSKVAANVAFVQAPYSVTQKGANWLWAWALAVPAGTKNADAAQRFVNWATSKEYIQLVAREEGWSAVPTGTRKSTYATPEFRARARFADAEIQAINSTNPNDPTLPKSPYAGIQFVAIPEFQVIGNAVSQQITNALKGKITVDQALKAAQAAADHEMRKAGYYK
jgi:sorbitol/mannitol transport system substrate-binding protein